MDFSDKCNLIFGVLGCSNADIARSSEIDPSIVSRFRTGSRQPRPNSMQFLMFCTGIIRFAQNRGMLEKLQQECNLPCIGNPEDEIKLYLTEKIDKYRSNTKRPLHKTAGIFSEKLNVLMRMLSISNIRLARALNVDSSLISRFRNGLRMPFRNNPLLESMCVYFYKTAKQKELQHELSDLIGVSVVKIESDEEFIKCFIKWLSDENGQQTTDIMGSFLEKLDNINLVKMPDLPPLSSILTADILHSESDEYIGIEGFRNAVVRFLGAVVMSGNQSVLKLYSDQNMGWLFSDPVFTKKWAVLMSVVLGKKTPVKMIHNINRNLDEMLGGIEKWIPLYMSGLIEGYYRKSHSDPWFSHTLFVSPGTAAICAGIVTGTEEAGIYQYSDVKEKTTYYENQIDALLKNAKPLIRVFKKNRFYDFMFFTGELSKANGTLKRLPVSLPFCTVPANLLERMLKRSGIPKEETENILTVHAGCVKHFENELKSGSITEYVAFPDKEDLSAGKVMLDLSDAFIEKAIFYTPEEYSEHIEHIMSLLDFNYCIIPLQKSQYANIQIAVKEEYGVMVQKTDNPVTVFWFSHPLMCRAFSEYIDSIGQKSRIPISDKKELKKYLEQYQK